MRLARLIVAFTAWSCCSLAIAGESLDEYIAALDSELHAIDQPSPASAPSAGTPPSLDAGRLLQQSDVMLHSATPQQLTRLNGLLIAFMGHRIVPIGVSPIPRAGEYLAFTEVHVIFSEILDRSALLQRAGWAAGDAEMLEALRRRACSAPSTIDFHRRALDGEIADGRYVEGDVTAARAVSARLMQRTDWYSSAANQSTCRDFSRVKVAP